MATIKGSSLFREQRKHGKKRSSKITAQEAKEYNRAKKTYNQRIDRQVERVAKNLGMDWKGMDTAERKAFYEKLVQAGVVSTKWTDTVGDFKSRRAFNQSWSELTRQAVKDNSRVFQQEKIGKMRNRLLTAIDRGYTPPDDIMAVLKDVIGNMSESDIIDFSFRNKDVVATTYDKYKASSDGSGVLDITDEEDQLLDLVEALRPYDRVYNGQSSLDAAARMIRETYSDM